MVIALAPFILFLARLYALAAMLRGTMHRLTPASLPASFVVAVFALLLVPIRSTFGNALAPSRLSRGLIASGM
jgi:hypothetical protein